MSLLKGDHALPDGGRAKGVSVTDGAKALSLPIGVSNRQINWRYVGAVGSCHLLAFLAFSAGTVGRNSSHASPPRR